MTRHLVKLTAEYILHHPVTLRPHDGRCVIFDGETGYSGRTWDDALEFLVQNLEQNKTQNELHNNQSN